MRQAIVIKDKVAMLIVVIVSVSMVILMLACAQQRVWYKPNVTQQEFAKDKYECMQEAQQGTSYATGGYCVGNICEPGRASGGVTTNWNLFNLCMEARGWESRIEKKK